MATFSIILPVRNGGEYVKTCVQSILAQTCTDFELIVLDNASTDGTPAWIEGLANPKILLLPASSALTIEGNWGRIARISKNPFITLIGHDDVLLPHYLEEMTRLIADYPDAGLYQTHFDYINAEGKVLRACKPMPGRETAPEFLAAFLQHRADIMGTGFMMRAVDYDRLGGIPLHYPNLLFADLELWTRLTAQSYKATSSRTCFQYRLHQSTTKTSGDRTVLQSLATFADFMAGQQQADAEMDTVIRAHSSRWLSDYAISLSHRLLRSPLPQRDGLTIGHIIDTCAGYARRLSPGADFAAARDWRLLAARLIDSNSVSRSLFNRLRRFLR
jgi:glycosyltransferase involved in cell wall biosynthesis